MAEVVLDTSAILAVVFGEPGAEKVRPGLVGARVSTVNISETASKLIDKGYSRPDVEATLRAFPIQLIPFDADLGLAAGFLRSGTRAFGLSLGDRACLALALRHRLPVYTTDRIWAKLNLGIDIRLIR